ncbi:TPA: nickel-dependent hydrogenase large subunit [Candidatus Poribacteria bacterium]|nr:nickel-dependent hydrogenase large subunit [Candidatus Poribacteria bacterium]
MAEKIIIDPITRIEGHLKVEAVVDDGEVKDAKSSGTLFRGIELIMQGRDPRDAPRIAQRICGVCPATHSVASTQCVDSAFGITDKIPENGRIIRNLILGSNYIQSHILHFYHLAALDYVDVTQAADYVGNDPTLNSVKDFIGRGELAPFFPRYEGDYRLTKEADVAALSHYVQALEMRQKAHKMLAIFGGKMPHNCGVLPGGVTEIPTVDKITSLLWHLSDIRDFIDNVYIPDIIAIAHAYSDYFGIGQGCGNLLSYGGFDLESTEIDPAKRNRLLKQGAVSLSDVLNLSSLDTSKIAEQVEHSWYDAPGNGHPSETKTIPLPDKEGAYSWLKSPRYDGKVYEVGPLARICVTYLSGDATVKNLVDSTLSEFDAEPTALLSVLGRHAARALDCKFVADAMVQWVQELKIGEPVYYDYTLPEEGSGMGLVEGPRGALGHWIQVKDGKIANYQAVVPTTWNASPRDNNDQPGPIEQALIGTKIRDPENPFEIVRIVRSFDPCLACSVHVLTLKRHTLGEFRVL